MGSHQYKAIAIIGTDALHGSGMAQIGCAYLGFLLVIIMLQKHDFPVAFI